MTARELKEKMQRANLSIYDLGAMVGRSHVTIWRWANGVVTSGKKTPDRPVPELWDDKIEKVISKHERIGRKAKP